MFDVVIIGAGVTGSAIAREVSRYKLNTCVIEKEEDVCNETSKANSAIIHAGFDAVPGTMTESQKSLTFHLRETALWSYVRKSRIRKDFRF